MSCFLSLYPLQWPKDVSQREVWHSGRLLVLLCHWWLYFLHQWLSDLFGKDLLTGFKHGLNTQFKDSSAATPGGQRFVLKGFIQVNTPPLMCHLQWSHLFFVLYSTVLWLMLTWWHLDIHGSFSHYIVPLHYWFCSVSSGPLIDMTWGSISVHQRVVLVEST